MVGRQVIGWWLVYGRSVVGRVVGWMVSRWGGRFVGRVVGRMAGKVCRMVDRQVGCKWVVGGWVGVR